MPEILEILAVLAALIVGVVVIVMIAVPVCRAIGWCFRQVFNFVIGEFGDAFRLIGAVILGIVYVPLIALNLLSGDGPPVGTTGGHCRASLARLECASIASRSGTRHGWWVVWVDRRPGAPVARGCRGGSDVGWAGGRSGQFYGYKIVGSLAGGGSGAKLYIAEPDPVKSAGFAREG